jgi:hypothetical protein
MMSSALVAHGQQAKGDILSDADKADIVEAALRLELAAQNKEFVFIRSLSSENIEFLEPSEISRRGFSLLSASQMRQLKEDGFVRYVVFKQIYARDGIVTVVLSRVSGNGRPCFGHPGFTQLSFTYKFKKIDGQWIGELVRQPPPRPVFFGRQLLTRGKSEGFRIKTNDH